MPVLSIYHTRLCASATFGADRYVIGGRAAQRRTVTTPLVDSLAAHSDLPRLDTGRLRATWLVAAVEAIGLKAFMDAAGITCTQRLGDLVAGMTSPSEAEAVTRLGAPARRTVRLDEAEAVVDASGVAERLEAALPVGVRPRQLSVRTLVLGIVVALGDGRPAHLTRVHAALVSLAPSDRRRLGVVVEWKCGPHVLTYRQIERTFSLVTRVLRKAEPDGTPAAALQEMVDSLSEASVSDTYKEASSSYAVDWTDLETFGRPVANNETGGADPDASWGHRRGNGPGQHDEVFFGYYLSCLTMVENEAAPAVPELCRGLTVTSCHVDPVPAVVRVIGHLVARGAPLRDVLSDSGYAHRRAEHWALPLRALGAELIMDLHPHDRGIRGTHQGAVSFNGNLYCPSTPPALLTLEPLARAATARRSPPTTA